MPADRGRKMIEEAKVIKGRKNEMKGGRYNREEGRTGRM